MTMRGHEGHITGMCILGNLLISVSWDQSIRLWDCTVGTCIHVIDLAHEGAISGIDAAAEHKCFATVGSDGIGYVWSVETFETCGSIKGHTAEISHIKWNSVLDSWVTTSEDSTIRMWQPDGKACMKEELLKKMGVDRVADVGEDVLMRLATEGFSALQVHPVNGNVIVGLSDATVAIVDMAREVVLQVYRGHGDVARSIVCNVEKNQLITGEFRVWGFGALGLGFRESADNW